MELVFGRASKVDRAAKTVDVDCGGEVGKRPLSRLDCWMRFSRMDLDWMRSPRDPPTNFPRMAQTKTVSYDELVLATGSKAWLPPVPGLSLEASCLWWSKDFYSG